VARRSIAARRGAPSLRGAVHHPHHSVIPANAGTQGYIAQHVRLWVPAFAGMTGEERAGRSFAAETVRHWPGAHARKKGAGIAADPSCRLAVRASMSAEASIGCACRCRRQDPPRTANGTGHRLCRFLARLARPSEDCPRRPPRSSTRVVAIGPQAIRRSSSLRGAFLPSCRRNRLRGAPDRTVRRSHPMVARPSLAALLAFAGAGSDRSLVSRGAVFVLPSEGVTAAESRLMENALWWLCITWITWMVRAAEHSPGPADERHVVLSSCNYG
jgi:hypothetical protein